MNPKEQTRLQVLNSLLAAHMTLDQATTLMGVSSRHTRRILAAYREKGVAAVVHGHRGRKPDNATTEAVIADVVHLARTRYAGANHTHLSELLAERDSKEDILAQTWECLLENDPENFELSMLAMMPTANDIDDARDQFIYVGSAAPIEDLKASRDEICGASASAPAATPQPTARGGDDDSGSEVSGTPLSFVSVESGGSFACGLKVDGSIACWGSDRDGKISPPSGSFVSVSAGFDSTCGIMNDGSVACWGYYNVVHATPPDGSFVSVSAAVTHTCGVRSGGSVPTSRWTDVPQPSILPPATPNWPFLLVCTERVHCIDGSGGS